jgi:hypothetical protein
MGSHPNEGLATMAIIKPTARILGLLVLLITVWRAPPGCLSGVLGRLWPLLLLLVGWW